MKRVVFGEVSCEVFSFDFLEFYGELGRGFAECHHIVPLVEAAFSRMTRLSDLAIVCANCHRMLHRVRPVLTVEGLKSLTKHRHPRQCGGTA
jgi:5-methylcytosine-specific restriction protein A